MRSGCVEASPMYDGKKGCTESVVRGASAHGISGKLGRRKGEGFCPSHRRLGSVINSLYPVGNPEVEVDVGRRFSKREGKHRSLLPVSSSLEKNRSRDKRIARRRCSAKPVLSKAPFQRSPFQRTHISHPISIVRLGPHSTAPVRLPPGSVARSVWHMCKSRSLV
jgi:hypothetical protein